MKHKTLVLSFLFTACAGLALAQNKISATGACGKADATHAIEAGDRAGHMLVVTQISCTWTTPLEEAGLESKSYTVAASAGAAGGHSEERGYIVRVMGKGDKAYISFQGSSTWKEAGAD